MTARMMFARASAIAIAAALLVFCNGSSGTTTTTTTSTSTSPTLPAATASVSIPRGAMGMGPQAFGVNPLVIAPGTEVTWTNNDTMAHTTTSTTNVWDSGVLNPGATFSVTFNSEGTFPYFCTIHGAASMSGTIVVQTAPSSGGTGGGGGGGTGGGGGGTGGGGY